MAGGQDQRHITAPSRRWVWAVLALSLAVNIFLAGLWIGGERDKRPPPFRSASPTFNLRAVAEILPSEQREVLRQQMRARAPEMREAFRARRKAGQRLRALMLAETVDGPALRQVIIEYQELSGTLRDPARDVVIDMLPELDLTVRQRLADIWLRGGPRHRPR